MTAPCFETKVLRDDVTEINAGEVLDNNNAHLMVEAITTALERGFKYIVLDMSSLEFLSSAGVGSILGTVESARAEGGDIVLCGPQEPILHVLEVLDLADYLTIKRSLSEAAEVYG